MNNQDIQLNYGKINEEIGSLPSFVTRMYNPGQSTFTFLIRLIIRAESSLIVFLRNTNKLIISQSIL